ncbi:hypothetical protein GCM10010211_20390 [Streptomyces albospinus]|uniref:Uncharacterized protein n=1 Tax=Streptomyces albospinus TaxID=285515 RepID=A0ABQ2UV57_9ACTN|nr:hypothetical protein [Streptomyces albospinus]GGU55552.1 hypothetical protein GCM10010211_20390 [Streptomyces albospinus]
MPHRDTDDVRFILLVTLAVGGVLAGWFLPTPGSYVAVVMTTICIAGMTVIHADLLDKIKEERRKQMRRELRERSRHDPDM